MCETESYALHGVLELICSHLHRCMRVTRCFQFPLRDFTSRDSEDENLTLNISNTNKTIFQHGVSKREKAEAVILQGTGIEN